jgi:hypothetical protein
MKNLFIIIFLLTLFGCKKSDDGTVEVIPLAPTELKGTIVSKDQVDLTWKDNSTNETGYKIERKTDSGNFTEIGSIAADVTTFSDKTVAINTNYTFRVYSFNKVGKSINYSNEVTIKTINVPTLTTTAITDVSVNSAKSGGSISSDGSSSITARGVVWGTATNPTIALSTKTSDGTGLGSFQSSIFGLAANTKYYVRAYATNNAGTSYGNELSFTTINVPTLTTTAITEITSNGAKSGGSISSDGSSSITARGVVWGTATNPTIALSTKTSDGTGLGSFQSSISGLVANTKYYVRAYATNTAGTSYGNELSFTTAEITSDAYVDLTIDGASKSRIKIANIGGTGFGPTCTKKVFNQHVVDNDNSEYSVSISFLHAYLDKDFQSLITMVKQKTITDSTSITSPSSSYCGLTSAIQLPYIIISYKDNKTNASYELNAGYPNAINSISNITKISTTGTVNNYSITGAFKSVFENNTNNKKVKVDGKYKIFVNTSN